MRIAVIDLGTNTCNLLIAEVVNGDYKILHQSKQLVKLGDDKIRENEISVAATQRTIEAFKSHKKIVYKYKVNEVVVLATSAVRSAANKTEYLKKLKSETGWTVKVITGEEEAELIFKGVLLAFREIEHPAAILDIGGGSNEIILAHRSRIIWKESKPTGMSRIINHFALSDPVQGDEVKKLQSYFAEQHNEAFNRCKKESVKMIIGCSGAFDTIADMIDGVQPGEKQRTTQEILLNDFYVVYRTLLNSTREERIRIKGMDQVRVDLIVPAVILIEELIREMGIQKIVQTDFALREGVLFEYLQKNSV